MPHNLDPLSHEKVDTFTHNNMRNLIADSRDEVKIRSSHGQEKRTTPHFRTPLCKLPYHSTRELLAADLVILNRGQVTRTIPELVPPFPNFPITPTGGRLKFNV
ncbi:hypothetical protein TNCV_2033491 [Trichonephila clavipes]|nr:hypothetical protein TNCV_2033491 [Trichonephila clavipes]